MKMKAIRKSVRQLIILFLYAFAKKIFQPISFFKGAHNSVT